MNDVASGFCAGVGVDYSTLPRMSRQRVNRSLTNSEIGCLKRVYDIARKQRLDMESFSYVLSNNLLRHQAYQAEVNHVDFGVLTQIENKLAPELELFNQECERKFGFRVEVLNSAEKKTNRIYRLSLREKVSAYLNVTRALKNISADDTIQQLVGQLRSCSLAFKLSFLYLDVFGS